MSMVEAEPHDVPLYWYIVPRPPASQNVVDAHETEARPFATANDRDRR